MGPGPRLEICSMPGKRVRVDPHLCEGHALCIDTAPEVFELTDSDVATCVENPPPELWEQVRAAVDACPRGAITVVDSSAANNTERTARP
jgi:ferredoxin